MFILSTLSGLSFYHRRLNADILDCHARYLALPTLNWLQYTVEVFSLYMAVRTALRRLHDVRREIEVCPINLVFLLFLISDIMIKA